ncbi:MAG: hypothetical protein AMJ54_15220 [Deltaproteobacteria bacterium SG8_13]|nr:MAG: hypothetical protein AMJ54_15220 [Deltaproteobacteria bacterium SG8_13]
MGCALSRREVLRFFMVALPAAAIGWKRIDFFDRELVCVHVYDPAQELPSPLLDPAGTAVRRSAAGPVFHVGLPELVLCRTKTGLLRFYPYFWPVSRSEVDQLRGSVQVLHQSRTIAGKKDVDTLLEKLLEHRQPGDRENGSLAVIFTLNDATRDACAAVVDVCRSMRVGELVVFKDPSRPPYLCSYPSRQKGFKRPPPIG